MAEPLSTEKLPLPQSAQPSEGRHSDTHAVTFREWITALKAIDDPKEAKIFIKRSLRPKHMVHIFGKYFFPHVIKGGTEVPDCHIALLKEMARREDGAIVFPRGFAKSTWMKIDTLHDIVYNLEPLIVYISASIGEATFHFDSMKSELEENKPLRQIYGNLVPLELDNDNKKERIRRHFKKWTNKHFETLNGINVIAKGSCKGRGVNIKNRRPTKIIIDDAEFDDQVRSEDRRKKFAHWLYNVIFPSKDKDKGFVKMIGTIIHPQCEVLKFYNGHGGIFRRAIENGESIWPDGMPLEKLLRIRDGYIDENGAKIVGIGSLAFEQEYQNNPVDAESAMFKEEWITRNQYDELPDASSLHAYDIVMAVDPNSGVSSKADRMGVCVLARHRATNLRYVVHAKHYARLTIDKRLEKMEEIYALWKPVKMGIEVVLNQRADHQLAMKAKKFRLVELSPKSKSKEDRAKYVQPFCEQGVIKFHKMQIELYEEMVQFPNGEHDDLFDAFMYANEMLDQMTTTGLKPKKTKSLTRGVRTKDY